MTRFLGNRIPQILMAAWVSFWPIALIVPVNVLFELLNGLLVATSGGIAVAYFASSWRQLRRRPYHFYLAHLLTLGVAMIHGFIVGIFLWGWAYQWLDRPGWMEQHLVRAWLVYGLWLGCVLQYIVTAQPDEDADHHERLAMQAWVRLGAVVSAGALVALLVLTIIGERVSS